MDRERTIKKAVGIFKQAHATGVCSIIEVTTIDVGRDIGVLDQMSQDSDSPISDIGDVTWVECQRDGEGLPTKTPWVDVHSLSLKSQHNLDKRSILNLCLMVERESAFSPQTKYLIACSKSTFHNFTGIAHLNTVLLELILVKYLK